MSETTKLDQKVIDDLVNGLLKNDSNDFVNQITTMNNLLEVTQAKIDEMTKTVEQLKNGIG